MSRHTHRPMPARARGDRDAAPARPASLEPAFGRVRTDELSAALTAPDDQIAALDAAVHAVHTAVQLATRPGARAAVSGAEGVRRAAAAGVAGGGGALPHMERIRRAFGRHGVDDVRAHVGGAARSATEAMGAEAYATGHHVAFRAAPDLHTASHEAAHVLQQRAGVQLAQGVGRVGDAYERHADAVADAVVSGRSAEPLLDQIGPARGGSRGAVQHKGLRSLITQQGADVTPHAGNYRYDTDWRLVMGGISPDDVRQGSLGDCYLMAALSAIARAQVDVLKTMVVPIGDLKGDKIPDFNVRFYRRSGNAFNVVWITVSGALPIIPSSSNSESYNLVAAGKQKGPNLVREIWPGVVEKAYAKFRAGGGAGSYAGLEGGSAAVSMEHITGQCSRSHSTTGNNALFDEMLAANKQRRPMTASTYPDAESTSIFARAFGAQTRDYTKESSSVKMANKHAYEVAAVSGRRALDGTVRIRNPWGYYGTMRFDEFGDLFREVQINGVVHRP